MLFVLGCMLLGACKSSESVTESMPKSMEQELIDSHIAALGGLETIRSVESLRMTGEIYVPSAGMTMPVTITQKRPSKMYFKIEIPAMGAEMVQAYDGETAWEINPMQGGTRKMTGEPARTIKEQADMDGILVDYEAKGFTMELVGEEDVKGSAAKKLKVLRPDSSEFFVFLDAASFMQVKVEAEGTNPMTGAKVNVETFMMDYRDVGGMMVPFGVEMLMDGEVFSKTTLQDVKTNVEVDETIFAYPKK